MNSSTCADIGDLAMPPVGDNSGRIPLTQLLRSSQLAEPFVLPLESPPQGTRIMNDAELLQLTQRIADDQQPLALPLDLLPQGETRMNDAELLQSTQRVIDDVLAMAEEERDVTARSDSFNSISRSDFSIGSDFVRSDFPSQ